MTGWHYGNVGWGSWLLMGSMMALFWGLLIAVGFALFRGLPRGAAPCRKDQPTLNDCSTNGSPAAKSMSTTALGERRSSALAKRPRGHDIDRLLGL